MKTVLTIAASDPSGGAGIQADLRVLCSQGIVGVSAITALTVQDTRGVHRVQAVAPDLLEQQLDVILADARPSAVKIGLLPGPDAVRAVAYALARHRPPNVVLDPVMESSGGVSFLDEAGQGALRRDLLPLCSLVTPNLPEAARFVRGPVETLQERQAAAAMIQRWGARAVLIKGGHLKGEPEDLLLTPDGDYHALPGERIPTPHTHGTGCFLSSAIAARLAHGEPLLTAVQQARGLLLEGLMSPVVVGKGRGSPDPFAGTPFAPEQRAHADRLSLLYGVYVLTDPVLQGSRTAEEVAEEALDGGAAVVQLRDKGRSTPGLVEEARRIARMAKERGRLFIVNDRVDVAAASGADGVHLGPDDMHPRDARRMLGSEKLIGVSIGTVAEAVSLAPWASYLAVGAIFGSSTKLDAGEAVGPDRIREVRAAVPGKKVVAIGGIHLSNLELVAGAGADSIAVISAVLQQDDITAATRELSTAWETSLDAANRTNA